MQSFFSKIRHRAQLFYFKINQLFFYDIVVKEVNRIWKKKDKKNCFIKLKKLDTKFKNHPLIKSKIAWLLVRNSKYDGFKYIENFEKYRIKWLKKNKKNLNEIFIPLQQVIGAFGNYSSLYYYILNNNFISKKKLKLILLVKETEKFTNYALFKFFKPYIKLIKDNKTFYEKTNEYFINKAPIEIGLQYKDKYYPNGIATNLINQHLRNNKKFKKGLFKLDNLIKKQCWNKLFKYGIKNNEKKWFVALHIRENNNDKLRNSNPHTYLEAVKYIISKGGHVIRVGDNKMTRLPKIKGLIDYPFTDLKSEIMDVFLGSECKFCLGTSSGFYQIPIFFGKPVLLVNYVNTFEYFAIDKNNLFLPKKFFYKKTSIPVSLKLTFGTKIGNYITEKAFSDRKLKVEDNSSKEILSATKEMFDILKNKKNKDLKTLNNKFKTEISKSYSGLFKNKLRPLAQIPSCFLKNFY
tara:strand:+ start:104 stop:1495 length:1392 start_codon:yes stop_codon:yes gene_type:complete